MTCTNEYFDLTNQWISERGNNIAVLYQNGAFFEIYALQDIKTGEITGSKIEEISNLCDLKIAKKTHLFKGKFVLQSGFKIEGIDRYIKKLQEGGFIIPIYEQEQVGNSFIRKLSQVISPGTYWNNDNEILSNNITCIWLHYYKKISTSSNNKEKIVVGLSNLDIFTGKSSIFEFENIYQHDSSTYDELERYISIYNPSEILFIHNLDNDIINDIIKFVNITCNSITKINIIDKCSLSTSAKKCEKQTL